MNYVDFAIAISVFLFFFAIILIFSTSYFANLATETRLSEFRVIAEDFMRQFAGRGGVPTDWETNLSVTPVQLGLSQKLYRMRVLVKESAGVNRTSELLNTSITFDEDCGNKTWNDTVRIYNENDNSTFFTLTDQVFCVNQYLKSANVTWQVNMTNTTANDTTKKFWIYYSGDYNVTAPNYTNPFNLTGFWRLDESSGSTKTLDSSVYENSGTLTNMNTAGNFTSGWNITDCKSGTCLKFDGVNDYIDVGNSTDLTPSEEISITLWMKTSDTTTNNQGLIDKWASNAGYMLDLNSGADRGKLRFSIGSQSAISSSVTVNDGGWHFVAVTSNGTTGVLYVDGINRGSGSLTLTGISSTHTLNIAGDGASTNYLNGTIDEVRIYNRALTGVEVNTTYNSTLSPVNIKVFPEEDVTALSPGKVLALKNVTYEELKKTMGEEYDFRIEIEEKQYAG